MTLHLRLNIGMTMPLLFIGPLPDFIDSMRPIVLDKEGNDIVSIQPFSCDEIPREATDGGQPLSYCKGLTVTIELRDVEPSQLERPMDFEDAETQRLLTRVVGLAVRTFGGIHDYFLKVLRRWWQEEQSPVQQEHIFPRSGVGHAAALLKSSEAQWLDSKGNWRPLIEELPEGVGVMGMDRHNPVYLHEWQDAMTFVEEGKEVNIRDLMLANSRALLLRDEARMAIVEAVIALESTIEKLLGKAILNATANIADAPTIDERKLDKVIEELGLRLATEVGLTLTMGPLGLDAEDIKEALAAVEVRNNIIHGPQRAVNTKTAWSYFSAIERIIKAIEHWAITPPSEKPSPVEQSKGDPHSS